MLYMYCKFCHKFDTKNRRKQSKVWKKEACTAIRKDVLHEASVIHREALQHERACHVAKVQGGNAGAGGTSVRCYDWVQ